MFQVIFTLDYELHGNGEGRPDELMVAPTDRLLRMFADFGARLTIMADVAEILKFREYRDQTGRDDHHYEAVVSQLRQAVRDGHDVQLHLHASYFNAQFRDGHWEQDWSEYDFAGLPFERMSSLVRQGKRFLEELLCPVRPDYSCRAFRAANWSVSPSTNVVRALLANDIRIDSSVFKHGRRHGLVNFDYRNAHSELVPWLADERDICRRSDSGRLLEVPIYSEARWIGAFLSLNRLHRVRQSRHHRLAAAKGPSVSGPRRSRVARWADLLTSKHAWKADFNQCTGRQLISALERAQVRHAGRNGNLPFVLIGHSKLFTLANERSLQPFLRHVAGNVESCRFANLSEVTPC